MEPYSRWHLHLTEINVDFRLAKIKYDGEFTPFTDFETIFHNLQPHPALTSPETESDYLRLIADGCLAVLLPTEDLNSDCERALVREILASLILRKGLDLMSEPYMMYEVIHNVPHCFLFH
jgi:PXA domain